MYLSGFVPSYKAHQTLAVRSLKQSCYFCIMDKSKNTNLVFSVTLQAEGNIKVEQTVQLSQVCPHSALLINKKSST